MRELIRRKAELGERSRDVHEDVGYTSLAFRGEVWAGGEHLGVVRMKSTGSIDGKKRFRTKTRANFLTEVWETRWNQ